MSGKLVIAVILALQVTVSLCEIPPPEQELVDKYNALKEAFYKRVAFYSSKIKEAIEPHTKDIPHRETAQEYVEDLQANPHVQGAVKVATGLAGQMTPVVDSARMKALGLYEQHARPWAGPYLDSLINNIREFLDSIMPVEEH